MNFKNGRWSINLTINRNTNVTPVFYNPNELLSNGEFTENWNNWNFYVYDNQTISYSPSIIDSTFVIDIIKSTGTDWHFGFQESGLAMKKAEYKLTFDAWAEQQKQMLITVSKNYGDWGTHLSKNVNITTSGKKYEVTLNMPVTDENVRLYFGVGRFLGKFYIDNISLTRNRRYSINRK